MPRSSLYEINPLRRQAPQAPDRSHSQGKGCTTSSRHRGRPHKGKREGRASEEPLETFSNKRGRNNVTLLSPRSHRSLPRKPDRRGLCHTRRLWNKPNATTLTAHLPLQPQPAIPIHTQRHAISRLPKCRFQRTSLFPFL